MKAVFSSAQMLRLESGSKLDCPTAACCLQWFAMAKALAHCYSAQTLPNTIGSQRMRLLVA